MKVVGIVPARMGNTRLPGKVLMDLCGMSMLERVVARAQQMSFLDKLFVIFPYGDDNRIIGDVCGERGWNFLQGDEDILGNLLSEFYVAAMRTCADVIVRIDSDDPFVDPLLAAVALDTLITGNYDYVSSKAERSGYPVGVGVEVFTKEALVKTYLDTRVPMCFEEKSDKIKAYLRNVTPYMYKNPQKFRVHNMKFDGGSFSFVRLTVDTLPDLRLARMLYKRLKRDFLQLGRSFGWRDVMAIFEYYPRLLEINSHVHQEYVR